METVQKVALFLTILGALNWGFVGLLDYNVVTAIFGVDNMLIPRVIFSLIGLAGLINIGLLLTPIRMNNIERK